MSVHITVPKPLPADDQMAFLTHQWRLLHPSSLFSDLGTSWSGTSALTAFLMLSSGWCSHCTYSKRDSTAGVLESVGGFLWCSVSLPTLSS